MRFAAALLVLGLVATGCTADDSDDPGAAPMGSTPEDTQGASPAPTTTPSSSPAPSPTAKPALRSGDFDAAAAIRVVRYLAGTIGPRHATSPAFREAVRWVTAEFTRLGYRTRREGFPVPGGISWGVPVSAGRSANVIASRPGFDPAKPHVVVGAQLDTVPQAPGAEDNASGVGVMLATATAVAEARTRLPVMFVAFGAEEPRGPTDDDHHYGSRAHVAGLPPAQRRAFRGIVNVDRVGVGAVVPVGSANVAGDLLQRRLLALARDIGVPATPDFNRTSDHWSYVRAGLPGVRLGSTPYAAYHSPADVPSVVDSAQLDRTGRLVLAWLAPVRD